VFNIRKTVKTALLYYILLKLYITMHGSENVKSAISFLYFDEKFYILPGENEEKLRKTLKFPVFNSKTS